MTLPLLRQNKNIRDLYILCVRGLPYILLEYSLTFNDKPNWFDKIDNTYDALFVVLHGLESYYQIFKTRIYCVFDYIYDFRLFFFLSPVTTSTLRVLFKIEIN